MERKAIYKETKHFVETIGIALNYMQVLFIFCGDEQHNSKLTVAYILQRQKVIDQNLRFKALGILLLHKSELQQPNSKLRFKTALFPTTGPDDGWGRSEPEVQT